MRSQRSTVLLVAVLVTLLGFAASSEAADPSWWWESGTIYRQSIVGGQLPDGGAAPINLDSAGRVITTSAFQVCEAFVSKVISCGTTPTAVPASRSAGSKSLEVTNSPENAGAPKVKCLVDPEDGGVGFGATNSGMVRSPGESIYFALDSTHTVICVCDTPATAITTTECVE